MTHLGRRLLVALCLCSALLLLARAAAPEPSLGAPEDPPPCTIPVEIEGRGVACVGAAEAASASLHAGDRIAKDGGRGRMAAPLIALFSVPIDLNVASSAELESLPNVGPATARRIIEARTERPFARVSDLRRVPGIGEVRYAALAPRLVVRINPQAPPSPPP